MAAALVIVVDANGGVQRSYRNSTRKLAVNIYSATHLSTLLSLKSLVSA